MSDKNILKITQELSLKKNQVSTTVDLLDGGGTVPFLSRYRKEATGGLDEVQIAAIRDRLQQLRDLDKRKEAIIKSLTEQEKLTDELEAKVWGAETMALLEDIYLPHKPKRRTRATIAKEKGLEPLAKFLFKQDDGEVVGEASNYINKEKEVTNADEALAGARDIIAEWINEDADARKKMRELFLKEGIFKSRVITGKEEEGQKYKDYFEWEEGINKAPSHRVLAMRRGEKEMILMLDSCPPEDSAIDFLERNFIKGTNQASDQVRLAIKDCYKRLLKPSMETEIRLVSKQKADEEAISVFAKNLRQLLMAAPLGQKRVLALDPGFRTGCKVVCLDGQGKLLENATIYPNEPQKRIAESEMTIKELCKKHQIEAIAIGNGTASRETAAFVKRIKVEGVIIVVVNESGASIYSASEIARDEFPDHDVTVRGSVSIGRRLMDPLAELVKIDPKSIGVGQYQHDVDQSALKKGLDDVVMSCVNAVGVEVNTASKELLTYVAGLGPQLAKNIVDYRNENGRFGSRAALKKVPRLGDKAFEQAGGFLRIRNAKNPLDSSAVHPERYVLLQNIAKDLGCSIQELISDNTKRQKVDLKEYVSDEVGLPTLHDIMEELAKPGRDPRSGFEHFSFKEGVNEMKDLRSGMKLPGIVTNITNFGAFVDIGVHQDGLVHISHIADRFVSDVSQVVQVQQKVEVTVLEVDLPRKRISLSMKSEGGKSPQKRPQKKIAQKKQKPEDFQSKLAALKGKFKK